MTKKRRDLDLIEYSFMWIILCFPGLLFGLFFSIVLSILLNGAINPFPNKEQTTQLFIFCSAITTFILGNYVLNYRMYKGWRLN